MASRTGGRVRGPALHESYLQYRNFRWLKLASLTCLLAVAAYVAVDQQPRPNGGTALGYALGTIALLLIVWMSLLGVRKRVIGSGQYSLKGWTSAHVYLGLALLTVATLHTGFQFAWNIHTLAYALMVLVIASGFYGVVAYARLPRQLSANRGELTQQQMLESLRTLDRQLNDAAQPLDARHSAMVRDSLDNCTIGGSLYSRLTGHYPRCGNARALTGLGEELQQAGDDPGDRLNDVLALLERKAAALAQTRRHVRIKTLLEIWLYLHVPLTFALIAALAAHVFSVFWYW